MGLVYAWVHKYIDLDGIEQYGICISNEKPPVGTEYKAFEEDAVPYLYVDEVTHQIADKRKSYNYILDCKQALIKELKDQTYNYITNYMPLWRQNSWSEFVRCYDKMQTMSLTKAEQLTITEMTNKFKLSPSEVYSRCQKALEWIIQCKLADEAMEEKINACYKWDDLKQIDITQTEYPAWPLDEEE